MARRSTSLSSWHRLHAGAVAAGSCVSACTDDAGAEAARRTLAEAERDGVLRPRTPRETPRAARGSRGRGAPRRRTAWSCRTGGGWSAGTGSAAPARSAALVSGRAHRGRGVTWPDQRRAGRHQTSGVRATGGRTEGDAGRHLQAAVRPAGGAAVARKAARTRREKARGARDAGGGTARCRDAGGVLLFASPHAPGALRRELARQLADGARPAEGDVGACAARATRESCAQAELRKLEAR